MKSTRGQQASANTGNRANTGKPVESPNTESPASANGHPSDSRIEVVCPFCGHPFVPDRLGLASRILSQAMQHQAEKRGVSACCSRCDRWFVYHSPDLRPKLTEPHTPTQH